MLIKGGGGTGGLNPMKKLVVYTAIFGGKDRVRELKFNNIDAYLFTEDRQLKSKTFKVIYVKPRFADSPHYSSRYYKILPHRIDIFKNYQYSFWIDGNREFVINPNAVVKSLKDEIIMVGRHYRTEKRDCYDEAEQCIRLRKDKPQKIKKQVEFYKNQGLPENFGLWGCPVMLRRHNDLQCIKFCEMWWEEILFRSCRDQISFPYIVWKTGIAPAPFKKGMPIVKKHKHIK